METVALIIIGVVALLVIGWIYTTAIKYGSPPVDPLEHTKIETPVWTSTRGPKEKD